MAKPRTAFLRLSFPGSLFRPPRSFIQTVLFKQRFPLADTPILDRQFLERLERLTIHWQRSFPGLVGGHNRSHFAGGGQEFLDHRHFHQGDDLRAVNWRAFMRLDKMFLKMFQIEPRVPVRMMIDTSVSMNADTGGSY